MNEDWKIRGDLVLHNNGEVSFTIHTKDEDFITTREVLVRFIAKIQEQIDNQTRCPFYVK